MSIQGPVMKYARNGRRRKGLLDLNVPPVENIEQSGGPSVACGGQVHHPAALTQPTPIDVEEFDDDVVISSHTAFEEAKKRSQRSRRTMVVDVEADAAAIMLNLNQANKRKRCQPNLPILNCDYVNLEGSSGSMRGVQNIALLPPPPPPSQKEPTFSCPVCIGPLVEEVTTKCGHIFCKECITSAIKAQHKCPTCRQKLTNRNLIRVYLPTAK